MLIRVTYRSPSIPLPTSPAYDVIFLGNPQVAPRMANHAQGSPVLWVSRVGPLGQETGQRELTRLQI